MACTDVGRNVSHRRCFYYFDVCDYTYLSADYRPFIQRTCDADEEAHGLIKVLTVPGKDKILGVTIVGEHEAELIAEYVMVMKHNIGLNKILGTIHIYPTMAEANKYVAGNWKRAHAPEKILRWVKHFHALRRSTRQ